MALRAQCRAGCIRRKHSPYQLQYLTLTALFAYTNAYYAGQTDADVFCVLQGLCLFFVKTRRDKNEF